MATPAYPATLPGPSRVNFRPGLQVLASDGGELGPIDVRRRSRQPTADAQVTFRYLEDDYRTFVTWWKATLLYGHRWFTLPLPSANGLVDHVVRFAKKYSGQTQGHRYVEVTAEIEIRERKIGVEIVVPPIITFELDLQASGWPGGHSASAYSSNSVRFTANPAKAYEITLPPGRLYEAWSAYPTDGAAIGAGAQPWILSLSWRQFASGGGFSDITVTVNNSVGGLTPAAARVLWTPLTIGPGFVDYYFWLNDPNPTDNRGGLSLLLTEL